MQRGSAHAGGALPPRVRNHGRMVVHAEPLVAPVSPDEALRRTAFLLERRLESSYKVEAFRKALATIRELGSAEVQRAVAAGELLAVPGIGKSSGSIITQAVNGELPTYLADLQEKSGGPLTEDTELFAQLRGDCHLHSNWSDGGSPIQEMALTAIELGHEYAVLTDHSPRLKVANGLTAARLTKQFEVIAAINAATGDSFRLLRGIEVDILDEGELDQTERMLSQLDFVVASVHSKLKMFSAPMTRRMIAAVENPFVNVLGHCTGRLVRGGRGTREQSKFDAQAVFEACAANGVAVEINSRPEREDPPDELIELAASIGCLFSIDSDAHAPGQLDMKAYGCVRAERLGIPAERVINTWPVDELLEWAAAKR